LGRWRSQTGEWRFKDGLARHVQLRREELTGVLALLLDAEFFEQVFIDCGVVTWPGEIDLAPDAMQCTGCRAAAITRFFN
jgi:hypothetical protein